MFHSIRSNLSHDNREKSVEDTALQTLSAKEKDMKCNWPDVVSGHSLGGLNYLTWRSLKPKTKDYCYWENAIFVSSLSCFLSQLNMVHIVPDMLVGYLHYHQVPKAVHFFSELLRNLTVHILTNTLTSNNHFFDLLPKPVKFNYQTHTESPITSLSLKVHDILL